MVGRTIQLLSLTAFEETNVSPIGRQYTLRELAKATGLSEHIIRHWVKRGLLPRTTPRGPNTRYDDEHRVRIKLMVQYMADGASASEALARVESAATYRDMLVHAGEAPAPPPPAPVVATAVAMAPSPGQRDVGYHAAAAHARKHELWEHVPLCPGVELRIRLDADTEARRVAREIEETFGGSASKAPG
jgi:hypothetical protein